VALQKTLKLFILGLESNKYRRFWFFLKTSPGEFVGWLNNFRTLFLYLK